MIVLILFAMIFCHIVDDFYLQGILAQLKQKSWWWHNAPAPLYKDDYKIALAIHSFSWSFMMHLPLTIYLYVTKADTLIFLLISYIINMLIHCWVDNLKANELSISLVCDQITHIFQIIVTWTLFIVIPII